MTKYILLAFSTLIAVACNNTTTSNNNNNATDTTADTSLAAQPAANSALDVQPLSNYFVKNNIKISDSLTFWVIDNQTSFDSLFGVAKTMTNEIVTPDFGTHVVIAATMPATAYNTQIQLLSATNDNDNNAEMHFVAVGAEKQSSTITPVWLGLLPKTGLKTVKLYTGDQLSKAVTPPQ
ncbi:hypothetical protein [Chitinophaga defluvii]|uniref:Uncharacterized protein n=1 Tax=Chitinophaga defluvii TaxID=3163343 RepID=A0ABV2T7S1_9BACT